MTYRFGSAVLVCIMLVVNSALATKFIAYGDSRDNSAVNQTQTTLFEAENPACIIHDGARIDQIQHFIHDHTGLNPQSAMVRQF